MTGGSSSVAVLDKQRLRADALAAALALRGIAASSTVAAGAPVRLAVVHADATDRLGEWPEAPPYVLLAAEDGTQRGAVERSALAVLTHSTSFADLEAVVRAALDGRPLPRSTTNRAPTAEPTPAAVVQRLSARERAVLASLAQGTGNEEIGADLGISSHTVRTHVQNIYGKLEVSNRHAAVSMARRGGLGLDSRTDR